MTFNEILDTMNEIIFLNQDVLQPSVAWIFSDLAVYPNILASINLPPCGHMMDKAALDKEYPDILHLIQESARVHPPFPHSMPEVLGQDIRLDNCTIPKGTSISVDLYSLNNNSRCWNQPDQFLLDRWTNVDDFASKWSLFRYAGSHYYKVLIL